MCPNIKNQNKPESHFEETRGFTQLKKHKNNNITLPETNIAPENGWLEY